MSTTAIQPGDETAPAVAPRRWLLFDPLLLLSALGLVACSLVTLKGATSHKVPGQPLYYVERQALFAGIGVVLVLVLSRIDYSRLREYKYGLYAVMVGLNLVVYGMPPIRGARRWIPLPLINFQSSEFGKILLVVALSGFVVDRSRRLHEWRTTARIMLLAVIAALLVIPQPDLGTGMVYVAIGFAILFFAGTSWKQLTGLAAMFIASIAIVLAGAPAARGAPAQALPGAAPDRVSEPIARPSKPDLQHHPVVDRHRLGTEDWSRTERDSDHTGLPAGQRH